MKTLFFMIILLIFTTCNNVMVPTPPLKDFMDYTPPIYGDPSISVDGINPLPLIKIVEKTNNSHNYNYFKFEIYATPINAYDTYIIWSTSNEDIVGIDNNGRIWWSNDTGSAVITAMTRDGNHTTTCTVKVVSHRVPVESIILSQFYLNQPVGGETSLNYTISPINASDQSIRWKSDNTTKATVSSNGIVRSIASGTTKIIITSISDPTVFAECTVRIP